MAQCCFSTLAAPDTAESNDVEAGARLPVRAERCLRSWPRPYSIDLIHPSEHFDDRREFGGVGDQIDVSAGVKMQSRIA